MIVPLPEDLFLTLVFGVATSAIPKGFEDGCGLRFFISECILFLWKYFVFAMPATGTVGVGLTFIGVCFTVFIFFSATVVSIAARAGKSHLQVFTGHIGTYKVFFVQVFYKLLPDLFG